MDWDSFGIIGKRNARQWVLRLCFYVADVCTKTDGRSEYLN